jgi:DNA-directed RNA polymerase specialized sigma24 family protein
VATTIDALQGFCLGPDGRAAAASELRALGLPTSGAHVDDLCQQVLVQVWSRLEAGDPERDRSIHEHVVPYARRSLRNAAVDLLRAGRRERLDDLLGRGDQGHPGDRGDRNDPSADLDDRNQAPWTDATADDTAAPAVRWALQVRFARVPPRDVWVASAGLVLSHLADHPDLALVPGTPRPNPRSRAAPHANRWAALAYAGRHDCFEAPETGAVRQRRSTALQRLDRTFVDAVERATAGGDGP